MHEVITLSFGPQANSLTSAFFNRQTEYFVYTKEDAAKSHVDPSVRFVYGAEYTPRAVFFEYRDGFGSWQQYNEQYEKPVSLEAIAVDQERKLDTQKLASAETWTSSLEFKLHPKSAFTIPNWDSQSPFGHQRGAPEGQNIEFDRFDVGAQEFEDMGNSEDYLDHTLRPTIEKCDLISGVDIATDFGGWSGFTSEFLETLRDDYLPRQPVFTWSISRTSSTKLNYAQLVSRLHALTKLTELSSLVFPLQDRLDAQDFMANAQSHLPAYETVCLLSSLRRERVPMQALCADLASRGNIVQVNDSLMTGFAEPKNVRTTVEIWRGQEPPKEPREGVKRYLCPQPEPCQVQLQVNDAPAHLRTLFARARHDVREEVYELTEPYMLGPSDYSDDEFA